jgi:PKD repeat protein
MHFISKTRCLFLFIALVLVSILVPGVTAAGMETGHPYLLFHDISEVPGYQFRALDPWKSYENSIVSSANSVVSLNFSGNLGAHDRAIYRGPYARDLGLAYQVTKNPQYAAKTKEALLSLETGITYSKIDRALALGSYSLAYDFVQPTLDNANDTIIRDKLATLADLTYKDLNGNGMDKTSISFADYHGQAYPMVGIAGAALSDYTNPNHLPLSSTPADWHKAGTDYLFVDDKLHSYGRSLFSFGFDEASGKYLNGAYKFYVLEDFEWWLQVYNHAYQQNPFDIYPAAKRAFSSELWDSLPNGYSSNFVTLGNTKWLYHRSFMNLYDDQTKSNLLNFDENLEKSTVLPYSRVLAGSGPAGLLYCVYGNYDKIPRTAPGSLSHLDNKTIFQVIKGNSNPDSDWLSLVTWNIASRSNRDMLHNDQLSFEYYSRGDLLLADAGEGKYVLDKLYGYYDIHHNTIAIENPRTPFPVSPWSGSASQGINKGNANGVITPVKVSAIIQTSWIQLIQTSASISSVAANTFGSVQPLSSPVRYERTILYPETDYFVIVDRMEGTEPWIYRNIFRPTSLMITPSADANKDGVYVASEVGHVNGALTIGSTPYNWQALPYKTETKTGITTSSITWTTKNPYGRDVRLNLFSSPSSEILIEKNVGRIGGYDAPSEVFSPIVWFRTPQATAEYRVTALLSRYSTEEAKTATQLAVTGTGHAMHVHSSRADDYIYTGKGNSSFAGFTTDADTVFIRKGGQVTEFTLLNGSSLKEGGNNLVVVSKKLDYFTLKQEGATIKFKVRGQNTGDINLYNINPDSITRDGIPYSNWIMQSTVLKISTDFNDREFEISTAGNPVSTPMAGFISSVSSGLSPLTITFTDTSTGTTPFTYAWDFQNDGRVDSTLRSPSYQYAAAGTYTVKLTVTNTAGSDTVVKTGHITVTAGSMVPATKIGVFRPSTHMFYPDYNGNGRWDGAVIDRAYNFGLTGDVPVSGDWNNDGKTEIGVFRPSTHMFYQDYNGNGRWDGAVTDRAYNFGLTGDVPVSGDWNNDGKTDIGVFRPSTHMFYPDYNGNGAWNGAVIDRAYNFGISGDIPVSGKWS